MLTDKDKKWLEELIENKIREALTVQVKMERNRDIETGQPLAVPKIEIKDVYLPAHWVEFLPFYEASIRGVQETSDHVKNSVNNIAGIMLAMENGIKVISYIAENNNIKREYMLTENNNPNGLLDI